MKKIKEVDNPNTTYCLVKYSHWECTGKHLDCEDCPMDCEYKKSTGGDINDQPTN